jgi:hypothetical protein
VVGERETDFEFVEEREERLVEIGRIVGRTPNLFEVMAREDAVVDEGGFGSDEGGHEFGEPTRVQDDQVL